MTDSILMLSFYELLDDFLVENDILEEKDGSVRC